MLSRSSLLLCAALLAVAVPALAQDEKPVEVVIGGGFTVPYSDAKKNFGTGGNFDFGANFKFKKAPMVAVQAKYGFNRFGSKDIQQVATLPAGTIGSTVPLTVNHTMHDADFSALLGPHRKDAKASGYGIVGLGYYHEIVNVTTPAVGLATVCDPWIYICYPVPVTVDKIVGERSTDNFGLNFGGGVTVKAGQTSKFYAEFRYIHTYGPSITLPGGTAVKANGNYWPFTFGFRLWE